MPALTAPRRTLLIAAACLGLLAACGDDDNKPYFSFAGGGFIFNYRVADSYYGFVAKVERKLPEGGTVEASFEDPSGGPAFVVTQPVRPERISYAFRSPPLKGIVKDKPYKVTLKLMDKDGGTVIAEYDKSYVSTLDEDIMPEEPLTIGPGYAKNPNAPANP